MPLGLGPWLCLTQSPPPGILRLCLGALDLGTAGRRGLAGLAAKWIRQEMSGCFVSCSLQLQTKLRYEMTTWSSRDLQPLGEMEAKHIKVGACSEDMESHMQVFRTHI